MSRSPFFIALFIVAAFCSLEAGAATKEDTRQLSPAATLLVTKTADTNDGVCDADCSLREAIAAAASGDTIQFTGRLFDTPQTISLTNGELAVTANKMLTIVGSTAGVTISGRNASRVLYVSAGANLTAIGLTITGGNGTGQFDNGQGGGIVNVGTLSLINSTVSGNKPSSLRAGGIMNRGTLTLTNTTITGNSAGNFGSNSGGGVYNLGTINATNTTITGNSATGTGTGGGILNSGTLNARNTIISGNTGSSSPNLSGAPIAIDENNIVDGEANVRLAPAGNYGGATVTHALLNGSSASDTGNDCVTNQSCANFNAPIALPSDQRGAVRMGQVDIGAFESNSSANAGSFRAVLPAAFVGVQYQVQLVPNAGAVSYSVTSGNMPDGINLTASTAPAVVSLVGTPTIPGTYHFSVAASSGQGSAVTDYEIVVAVPNFATLTVTKTADTNDGVCNADCSLREAIASAVSGDTIRFDTNGVFAQPQTITLSLGLLSITRNISIAGTGKDRLRISGNGNSQVFANSATTTIRDVTVSDGSVVTDGGTNAWGGGINNTGDLTLVNVTVTANRILDDARFTARGGGISSSNRLTLINSTVSNNGSGRPRGTQGGGIHNTGWMLIKGSTISDNSATEGLVSNLGGGIYNGGTAIIVNSTIASNVLRLNGYGGGIYAGGPTTIVNSTISGNAGRRYGGGIYVSPAGGSLTIGNTIVSDNSANIGAGINGAVTSLGYNLIDNPGAATITGDVTGNILNQNARLGPFAENGGPTKTSLLLPDSPAIDAGSNALALDENNDPLTGEQRGGLFVRVAGTAVDIGATEYTTGSPDLTVSEVNGALIADGGTVNFGTTSSPIAVIKAFGVSNTSSTPLNVANLSVTSGFTVTQDFGTTTIPPGTTRNFVIRMEAATSGAKTALVKFDSNAPNSKSTFEFSVGGVVDPQTATSVFSIVRDTPSTCGGTVSWTVQFTAPVTNLTTANFQLVDVNNSLNGEQITQVSGSAAVWHVTAASGTGNGLLGLDMVNNFGVPLAITNLPFTGQSVTINARPEASITTAALLEQNSVGNIASAPSGATSYNWSVLAGGTLTAGQGSPNITFSVGGSTAVIITLAVGGANGCTNSTFVNVPTRTCSSSVAVTNTDDGGSGSLRAAIDSVCIGGTVNVLGSVEGTLTLTADELVINRDITINGSGTNRFRISGDDSSRVFQVNAGNVVINDLTIQDGFAADYGGGIRNQAALTLNRVAVVNNRAPLGSGGIDSNNNSTLTINNSTISDNSAPFAGGVQIYYTAAATIINSTISGNRATMFAGGVNTDNSPNVNIINSTITANSAPTGGGFNNSGSTVNALNSIIGGNTATVSGGAPDFAGILTSQGYNLIGNSTGTSIQGTATGNIINQNARLLPLADNGGATPTHALQFDSPAINAGTATGAPASDQRGRTRVGATDIGAFEAPGNLVVTNTGDSGPGSLRAAVTTANSTASDEEITFAIPPTDANFEGGVCTIALTGGELSVGSTSTAGFMAIRNGGGARTLNVSGNLNSRVFNVNAGANLTLDGLTICDGRSSTGAGIQNDGTLTVRSSWLAGNAATGAGGAIFNNGTLDLTDSTVSGNSANNGGGIATERSSTSRVVNSTISGNVATANGGGIYNNLAGGLISLTLINCTISNNQAIFGGGVMTAGNDSVTGNLLNTIVAGNRGSGGTVDDDFLGFLNSLGSNLFGTLLRTNITGDTTGNILGQNARFAPLGFYGGATPTAPLMIGSPAIDAGNGCVVAQNCAANNPISALAADQRGAARVGNVDIGAFEANSSANGGTFRATLPDGRLNSPYSFTLVPSNGTTSYAVSGGTLPPGMNLTTAFAPNAVVSLTGTPTSGGVFNFSITATNGANTSVTDYTLNVFVPTAARVSVSGRVMTNDGRGLRNATVTLTDASGNSRTARTSSFGYFIFDDVEAGQTVVVEVRSKRFTFAPQVVFVGDEITGLDFTAASRE